MNTIALVSCTKASNDAETLLHKSVSQLTESDDMYSVFDYVHFFCNNTEGLSKRYNEFIDQYIDDYEFIVFIHDDVFLDDGKIRQKIITAHKHFDIVGVAGGINPSIKEPALWHIMCGGFGPNLRGFAGHYVNDQTISITNFGVSPSRVAIADGVFLSVSTKKIKQTGWRFNEKFTFHHYDIASCLDANKLKMKVGVWPILLYHKSPGLRSINDPVFVESQSIFMKEYNSY
jgi:hypothetical protein